MSVATTNLNYVELPAGDLEATKAFYTNVFGWSFTDYGPDYAAATIGNLEIGFNTHATVAPALGDGDENGVGPFLLFETDDLEASLADVDDGGGVIVSQPYGYPGGRRFHFRDPSGNVLGVYRSDQT